MSDDQQQLSKILRFISRNLRLLLVCLLCSLTAGVVWYLQSPRVYKSTAIIKLELHQINSDKMRLDDTIVADTINTVSQQVVNQSNLEEIIVAQELYPELRRKRPIADIVMAMRKAHITIEPSPKLGTNFFQVSYEGEDPRKVMLTTNSLATKFVDENLKFRDQLAKVKSAHVKEELAIIKASLDKQEKSIRDYKLRYFNELPEQRPANINRLTSLETKYQDIQNSLQDLARTKILIQEQITMRKDIFSRLAKGLGGTTPDSPAPSELTRVRQELEKLRSRYTENHPDVKRLKGRLAILLKEQVDPGEVEQKQAKVQPVDIQVSQLEIQLKELDINEGRLNRELEETSQQIQKVQRWVEASPIREAQWAALTRDYAQLQGHYQALVGRDLEAESADLLGQRQKHSQFSIIEPAIIATKPSRPKFLMFMGIAAILGLGFGLSLPAAMGFFDTSFKGVEDLESYLGLPVTCAIPEIQTSSEKLLQRRQNIVWRVSLGVGFTILICSILQLWWIEKIII